MAVPIRVLLSQTSYLTDGTTTVWDFSFAGGYIQQTHVRAQSMDLVTKVITPITLSYPGSFIGPAQIQITPALPVGAELTIFRDSLNEGIPLVNFEDKASLTEVSLDVNAQQAIFSSAESNDLLQVSIEAVSTIQDSVNAAAGYAADAASSANAAENAQDGAEDASFASSLQALAAAGSASAASASASSAAASAVLTDADRVDAEAAQVAASASAAAAAASASSASTSASTATTQAGIATTQAGNAATSASSASTSASTATTQAGIATTQAGIATDAAAAAAVSAAEAAASAESIEGGPVASWVGLTGTINGSEAKDALSLPSDTVGELALKYSIYGGALSGPFTACFGGTTAPSGTVTVDAATGNTFNVDLAGNMTSLVVNNPTAWQTITLRFYNGGSARTYAWNTATFKIDGSPLLAANRVNLLTLLWNTGLWEGAWVNVPG